MDFLTSLKNRAPEYDSQYYDLILNFTIEQGGKMGTSSEEDRWKQGKFFSTRYEIYMYAALLGLKNNYKLPLNKGKDKSKKFIEIKYWQPSELADFILMSTIAKSNLNLQELEMIEEYEVEKKITQLKNTLEEYANGGFDIIRSKADDDPNFFLNENSFIDILDEKLPK